MGQANQKPMSLPAPTQPLYLPGPSQANNQITSTQNSNANNNNGGQQNKKEKFPAGNRAAGCDINVNRREYIWNTN